MRVAVIGISGGGKSTPTRKLAVEHDLPCTEIDNLLWRPGWIRTPEGEFSQAHDAAIAGERWIIDGLDSLESVAGRLERTTTIILVDLPLWMHFWLTAERQIAWASGELEARPAGAEQMPPTERLFQTIWQIDQEWMPRIREMVAGREGAGVQTWRIADLDALRDFSLAHPFEQVN